MAKHSPHNPDIADELVGFVESNEIGDTQQSDNASATSNRRSPAKPRRAVAKTPTKQDDLIEGTDDIDADRFVEALHQSVREKKAKLERVHNLLNHKAVRAALKEFIDEIGGIDKAFDRLALIAPDVKKSSFVKAWRECGPRWPPQTAPLMATQTAPGRTVRLWGLGSVLGLAF